MANTDIQKDNVLSIVSYLDYFEQGDINYVIDESWSGIDYTVEVNDFINDLYENGFIVPFDWKKWQPELTLLHQENPDLEGVGLEIIQKLITTYVRKERVTAGYLLEQLENGRVIAILRRLKNILSEK